MYMFFFYASQGLWTSLLPMARVGNHNSRHPSETERQPGLPETRTLAIKMLDSKYVTLTIVYPCHPKVQPDQDFRGWGVHGSAALESAPQRGKQPGLAGWLSFLLFFLVVVVVSSAALLAALLLSMVSGRPSPASFSLFVPHGNFPRVHVVWETEFEDQTLALWSPFHLALSI